jgi:hypothetical protein
MHRMPWRSAVPALCLMAVFGVAAAMCEMFDFYEQAWPPKKMADLVSYARTTLQSADGVIGEHFARAAWVCCLFLQMIAALVLMVISTATIIVRTQRWRPQWTIGVIVVAALALTVGCRMLPIDWLIGPPILVDLYQVPELVVPGLRSNVLMLLGALWSSIILAMIAVSKLLGPSGQYTIEELAVKLRLLRRLLASGATLLVFGVIAVWVFFSWPMSIVPSWDKPALLSFARITALVCGCLHAAILLAVFIPAEMIFRADAEKCADACLIPPAKRPAWFAKHGLNFRWSALLAQAAGVMSPMAVSILGSVVGIDSG